MEHTRKKFGEICDEVMPKLQNISQACGRGFFPADSETVRHYESWLPNLLLALTEQYMEHE